MHFWLLFWCVARPCSPRYFLLQYGHLTFGEGAGSFLGGEGTRGKHLREERLGTGLIVTVHCRSFGSRRGSLTEESASIRWFSAMHASETWRCMFEAFLDTSIRLVFSRDFFSNSDDITLLVCSSILFIHASLVILECRSRFCSKTAILYIDRMRNTTCSLARAKMVTDSTYGFC